MIKFEYHNENFNRGLSEKYNLSILVGVDSFVFTVFDENGAVLVLQDLFLQTPINNQEPGIQSLQKLLDQEQLLKLPYKNAELTFSGNSFVLVPDRLFAPSEAAVYLAQAVTLGKDDGVGYSEFPDLHSHLVFSFPERVLDLIRQVQPTVKINHVSEVLRIAYSKYQPYQPASFIGLHFRGNHEFITVVKNGFIHFHQCYDVTEAQDALYFLLLAADATQCGPEETPIVWSGNLVDDSEILKLVKRYFREVKPIETGPFLSEDLIEKKYLDLQGPQPDKKF